MYYNSDEIDEDLKCSVCKQKFSGDVRLVPDCGESICDGCYEELMDSVDEAGIYKCLACKEEHTMSKKGLPAIKSLNRIAKRRKVEKSLSDEARALKSLVESFDEKIKALEEFDERDHINYHCDELEIHVREQIESLMKELSEIEKSLMKQIADFRKSCLDAWSERRSREDEPTHQEATNQTTKDMRKKATEFSSKWADYFFRIDAVVADKKVRDALAKAKLFERNLNITQNKLRSRALNGHTMTFMAHDWLIGEHSPLRRAIKLTLQDDRVKEFQIGSTSSDTLTGHSKRVRQVLFLENGNLASCANDETIRIWDPLTGTMLFMLEEHDREVYSLAMLWNGWLASSSYDCTIKIWDLDARREIRTLTSRGIGTLKSLRNGNLVSYSTDGTIKIWNPYLTENNLLLTITGHEGVEWYTYGVLSNDKIVTLTCSVDETPQEISERTLKVWNTDDGQLVKSVSTKLSSPSALLVLANDQVALGSRDGIINVIDLDDEAVSITIDVSYYSIVALAQLPNGNLVSCSSDYGSILQITMRVWDLEHRSLLQTIKTDHTDHVLTMAISPDSMILATGSVDNTIKLWPIN